MHYKVIRPFFHRGHAVEPGAELELTTRQAVFGLAARRLEPAPSPSGASAAPKPKPKGKTA